MYLPKLENEPQKTTEKTVEFKGINYTDYRKDGEMRDSFNISSDNYPTLCPRKRREVYKDDMTNPTDIVSIAGKLAWIDNGNFYFDGVLKGRLTDAEEHYLAVITNRVVIMPDKMLYDVSTDELSQMERGYTVTGDVTFLLATSDPSEDQTITFTMARSDETDLRDLFSKGDVVHFEGGVVVPSNNKAVILKDVGASVLTVETSTFVLPPPDEETPTPTTDEDGNKVYTHDTGLVVVKTSDGSTTLREYYVETYDDESEDHMTLSREVPDLKFIVEYGNRIWGVKDNTIYGSKLGDPYNFDYYNGLSTDSYTVEVGSQGEFTAVCPYSNQIVFFKENTIHKLFGSKPSAFNIMTSYAEGVKAGSHRSLALINDTVFYLAKSGVMAYTGNLPELVSSQFGSRSFAKGVGSPNGRKYRVCLEDEFGDHQLMEYDTRFNVWIKVNDENIVDMCYHDGHLYTIVGNKIISYDHGNVRERFRWYREFAETNENTLMPKTYSKIFIDARGDDDAYIRISVRDAGREWREVFVGNFAERKSIRVPIIIRNSNILQLRVEGEGVVKIHSIGREITVKGEVWGIKNGVLIE